MSDREAMKEALRLLTKCAGVSRLWQVTDACDILRARLAAPCLEVTVDPRLTLDEAAAISSALAALDDAEALRRENERLRQINWSHEMKLSVRGYEMQIDSLKADNERLRGLLTDASKAVWMNYDGELLDRIEAALQEVQP